MWRLPAASFALTQQGWKRLDQLADGESVLSMDFAEGTGPVCMPTYRYVTVSSVRPAGLVRPQYRVCGPNHLPLVLADPVRLYGYGLYQQPALISRSAAFRKMDGSEGYVRLTHPQLTGFVTAPVIRTRAPRTDVDFSPKFWWHILALLVSKPVRLGGIPVLVVRQSVDAMQLRQLSRFNPWGDGKNILVYLVREEREIFDPIFDTATPPDILWQLHRHIPMDVLSRLYRKRVHQIRTLLSARQFLEWLLVVNGPPFYYTVRGTWVGDCVQTTFGVIGPRDPLFKHLSVQQVIQGPCPEEPFVAVKVNGANNLIINQYTVYGS